MTDIIANIATAFESEWRFAAQFSGLERYRAWDQVTDKLIGAYECANWVMDEPARTETLDALLLLRNVAHQHRLDGIRGISN